MLRGDGTDRDLIGLLYEGLLEADPWSSLLGALRERLKASSVSLLMQPRGTLLPVTSFRCGGSPEGHVQYRGHYHLSDPFVNLPDREVVTLDEFVDRSDPRMTEAFDSFLAQHAARRVLGIDFALDSGATIRFRVARGGDMPDFDEDERALCLALVPHFDRALRIFVRLDAAESARLLYQTTVEQLSIGAMVVSADGQMLRANPVAEAILQAEDGIALRGGRIVLDGPAASGDFGDLLQQAAQHGERPFGLVAPPLRIERTSGKPAFGLAVRPGPALPGQAFRGTALVIVTGGDRGGAGDAQAIAKLLGVSRAEAALATLLAQGVSLYEAADLLGVQRTTVRGQLRSIFAKTGVKRQPELVRLVLRHAMALPGAG